MKNIVGTIVGIFVAYIVLWAFKPVIRDSFAAADVSAWAPGAAAIWPAMPILIDIMLPGPAIFILLIFGLFIKMQR